MKLGIISDKAAFQHIIFPLGKQPSNSSLSSAAATTSQRLELALWGEEESSGIKLILLEQ